MMDGVGRGMNRFTGRFEVLRPGFVGGIGAGRNGGSSE